MPRVPYKSISVPEELVKAIEKILEDMKKDGIGLGYRSVSEFCVDAIRRQLQHIREKQLSK